MIDMKRKEVVKEAADVLRSGGVIIFPTDTVWGVGALLKSEEGIERLYEIKKRKRSKPTAVLVSDLTMAERYGTFSDRARELADKYWPGGLTIIVPARIGSMPASFLGTGRTVGLRVPRHDFILGLLSVLDAGIVASSANIAGREVPVRYEEIDEKLLGKVDFVVPAEFSAGRFDAGLRERVASTVVDTTQTPMRVLREGSVRIESS